MATYTFHNPSGSSYFVLDLIPREDGYFPSSSAQSSFLSPLKVLDNNTVSLVKNNYKLGLIIPSGTSSFSFYNGINIPTLASTYQGTGDTSLTVSGVAGFGSSGSVSTYSAKQLREKVYADEIPKNDYFQFKVNLPAGAKSNNFTLKSNSQASSYNVDWGDGTVQTGLSGDTTHTYSTTGDYIVQLSGSSFVRPDFRNGSDPCEITDIENFGNLVIGPSGTPSLQESFQIQQSWTISAVDALDTSGVTSLYRTFGSSFGNFGLSGDGPALNLWDTSNVTNMNSTFGGCDGFNMPLGNWDTSNVTNMYGMFQGCESFNQDIGKWNVSKCTSFADMFYDCYAFDQDLGNWAISGSGNGSVNAYYMFQGINSTTGNTFNNGGSPSIDKWNAAAFTSIAGMFKDAHKFNQPIGSWDVSNITTMQNLFEGAKVFNQDIGGWNMSNLTGTDCKQLFYKASAFNNGGSPSINNWDVSNLTDFTNLFRDSVFNQPIYKWDISSGTLFTTWLSGCPFNQDVSAWSGSLPSNISNLFKGASEFNNGGSPNIKDWDVSSVTNFSSLFHDASSFNQDISKWDISSGTSFSSWLFRASSFDQDLSVWSGSLPANLTSFFSNATSFNNGGSPNINDWDTSNVDTMLGIFVNASSFNQPIGDWDMSNADGFEYQQFYGATSFNQDISNWKFPQAVYYVGYAMFKDASSYDQNMGDFALPSGSSLSFYPLYMFDNSGMSTANYTDTIVGWANQISSSHGNSGTANLTSRNMSLQNGMTFDNTRSGGALFTNASASRAWLTGTLSWTISGDTVIN
jgi:surface protein